MSDQNIQNMDEEQPRVQTESQETADGASQEKHYVLVKFLHSSETQLCHLGEGGGIGNGEYVIVPSRYGKDIAVLLGPIRNIGGYDTDESEEIIRKATEEDIETYRTNLKKEEDALHICKEKVEKHNLDMKLVSAHYLVDEPKILFFFTADARVDFRELVKDLVSVFKMRIELRQIGVRDESRVLGGLAVCGRNYCCNGITDKLNPVSIKMAKEQNLSLNSMKISGPCGRLLCCLSYEYDFYREEKAGLPQEGSRIRVEEDEFKVTDVNILARKIHLQSRDGRVLDLPFKNFHRDEKTGYWNAVISDIIT